MTGDEDGHEAGRTIISLRGRGCGDVYAALILWTAGAFHYAGDFSELAADFFYHFLSCALTACIERALKRKGSESSDEEAYHDFGVFEVYGGEVGGFGVGDEEGEGGEGRGAYGEAFADGRGGVAYGVEVVCDVAYFMRQFGHFGYAAGVVGDGAVGVY